MTPAPLPALVTVETFTDPVEAHISRGLLESEGIPASLGSEHHVWASWHFSQALGGVRLQVPAEYAARARDVLERRRRGEYQLALEQEQELEPTRCSNCGSADLRFTRSPASLLLLFVTLGISGLIFPPRINGVRCNACRAVQGRASGPVARRHLPAPALVATEEIRNAEVADMAQEAARFLMSHPWCKAIASSHLAWAVAGVVGVFLFRIVPTRADVDETLWVVVGDLPTAYVAHEGNPTWRDALASYVSGMERWVEAVRSGGSLDGTIPVAAEPTPEHASMLAGRLRFISRKILAREAGEIESDR